MTPARFFLGVDLVYLAFLRGEGMVSIFFFLKNTITRLICRLAPFWEHRGGGGGGGGGEVGPFWKNPRINSALRAIFVKIYPNSGFKM